MYSTAQQEHRHLESVSILCSHRFGRLKARERRGPAVRLLASATTFTMREERVLCWFAHLDRKVSKAQAVQNRAREGRKVAKSGGLDSDRVTSGARMYSMCTKSILRH